MSAPEKRTPGTIEGTGGQGEHDEHNPNIIPENIPSDDTGADQKDLLPDTAASVAFMRNFCGDGPRVLTSIVPDGGRTATATFAASKDAEMAAWIDERQGKENIYFTVNGLYGPVTSKPNKGAVAAIRALHADVDPRAGEDPASERRRAWSLLRVLEPTAIIDSGGGLQAFWLLREEVAVGGSAELAKLFWREMKPEARGPLSDAERAEMDAHKSRLAETVEGRNLTFEAALQADNCHNADRIMRLVGTVNLPNERKRKRGRKPRVSRLLWADWSRRHALEEFESTSVTAPVSAARVAGPVRRLSGVDELPEAVSAKTRALIVNGKDPDEPGKWENRSELVLHVLCEMIRADVPDDVLLGVILDPDFRVSDHVFDQSNSETYARRQVQRALERQPRPGPVLHGGAMDWARAVRSARWPRLLHHHEEFLDWDGAAYTGVDDGTVRAEAWAFLETCRVKPKEGEIRPFNPTSGAVSTTVDALKAVTHLAPSREEPPRWLDGRAGPDPLELLPTRSGLLHLPTGDLLPATPELFTRNALDFAHDADAAEPVRWLAFLREVWPGEDEADCIAALQEFMGYLLTPDTSLQKALLIPGPKRSGKGTIGRIMGKLVGEANTVAPSLNSFGKSDFGLEPLLAKQLAIVSDMRLSGRTDEAAVAENLLRITGEDRISVNRKHRSAVEVTLRARFVVMTNEVPRFADRSGALVSRFIVLPMRQSFFGREDTGLTGALMAELPGILNWAVEGWRRVRATGRITQPEVGADVSMQMGDLSSPIPAFVREWCEVGPEHWVAKDRLFAAFREWHRDHMGQDYLSNANIFARDLYSAMDQQVRDSKGRDGGDRVPGFRGIALRAGFRHGGDTPF